MLLCTLDLLRSTECTGAVRGLPVFITRLAQHVAELNELGVAQGRVTQGTRLQRDKVLGDLRDTALELAAIVAVYAAEHRQFELLTLVNITPTAFNTARLAHKTWLANRVADSAENELPQLAPFGVTPATIAALRAKIAGAQAVLEAPRGAILQRQSCTRQIETTLREAAVTLTQIDRLLFPLRRGDPEFHADYRSARRVMGRCRGVANTPAAGAMPPAGLTSAATAPAAPAPTPGDARAA